MADWDNAHSHRSEIGIQGRPSLDCSSAVKVRNELWASSMDYAGLRAMDPRVDQRRIMKGTGNSLDDKKPVPALLTSRASFILATIVHASKIVSSSNSRVT